MPDQSRSEELLVYFAHCPTHGPEHRIYAETNLHTAGSIRAVESVIESETYWFMRLGVIELGYSDEHLTLQTRHPPGSTTELQKSSPVPYRALGAEVYVSDGEEKLFSIPVSRRRVL